MQPLYDYIIVKRVKEQTTSTGGIIMASAAVEIPNQGEILAVGEGRIIEGVKELEPLRVKVGDKVVFTKFAAGDEVDYKGTEAIYMKEKDVVAILD